MNVQLCLQFGLWILAVSEFEKYKLNIAVGTLFVLYRNNGTIYMRKNEKKSTFVLSTWNWTNSQKARLRVTLKNIFQEKCKSFRLFLFLKYNSRSSECRHWFPLNKTIMFPRFPDSFKQQFKTTFPQLTFVFQTSLHLPMAIFWWISRPFINLKPIFSQHFQWWHLPHHHEANRSRIVLSARLTSNKVNNFLLLGKRGINITTGNEKMMRRKINRIPIV